MPVFILHSSQSERTAVRKIEFRSGCHLHRDLSLKYDGEETGTAVVLAFIDFVAVLVVSLNNLLIALGVMVSAYFLRY